MKQLAGVQQERDTLQQENKDQKEEISWWVPHPSVLPLSPKRPRGVPSPPSHPHQAGEGAGHPAAGARRAEPGAAGGGGVPGGRSLTLTAPSRAAGWQPARSGISPRRCHPARRAARPAMLPAGARLPGIIPPGCSHAALPSLGPVPCPGCKSLAPLGVVCGGRSCPSLVWDHTGGAAVVSPPTPANYMLPAVSPRSSSTRRTACPAGS